MSHIIGIMMKLMFRATVFANWATQ